jgi:glycosyltransferase involved in cell wall biosynthesis
MGPNMKVLVLTVGDSEVASTRYRFGQFEASLAEEGVWLSFCRADRFRDWDSLRAYDLVVVQKRLMRRSWVRRLRAASRCLIFDTDDAIWEPHERRHSWWTRVRTRARLRAIVGAADLCTVPNEHLAAYLRPMARRVEWVPMALDPTTWSPSQGTKSGKIRLGWAGAPANLIYLEKLNWVLGEVLAARPQVELLVFCGEPPGVGLPPATLHHPFSPGSEPDVVRSFDIGLLPLPEDAFAAGKSPIKAIQYAASGVACIASPVGATCELVIDGVTGLTASSSEQWREALLRLIDEASLRLSLGQAARDRFLEFHTLRQAQGRLLGAWRMALSDRTADS